MPKKKKDFKSKIMDYYNKYCKDKGLIFVKSEKRIDALAMRNSENQSSKKYLYDFTFRFKDKEILVTFSEDDEDFGERIKHVLRENDIYL